jgi:hypothetical protein
MITGAFFCRVWSENSRQKGRSVVRLTDGPCSLNVPLRTRKRQWANGEPRRSTGHEARTATGGCARATKRTPRVRGLVALVVQDVAARAQHHPAALPLLDALATLRTPTRARERARAPPHDVSDEVGRAGRASAREGVGPDSAHPATRAWGWGRGGGRGPRASPPA